MFYTDCPIYEVICQTCRSSYLRYLVSSMYSRVVHKFQRLDFELAPWLATLHCILHTDSNNMKFHLSQSTETIPLEAPILPPRKKGKMTFFYSYFFWQYNNIYIGFSMHRSIILIYMDILCHLGFVMKSHKMTFITYVI